MALRQYIFTVRVLDERHASDEKFLNQVQKDLDVYFEALDVEVELIEAADFWTVEGDLALADA